MNSIALAILAVWALLVAKDAARSGRRPVTRAVLITSLAVSYACAIAAVVVMGLN